jgi:hypothetical protein
MITAIAEGARHTRFMYVLIAVKWYKWFVRKNDWKQKCWRQRRKNSSSSSCMDRRRFRVAADAHGMVRPLDRPLTNRTEMKTFSFFIDFGFQAKK